MANWGGLGNGGNVDDRRGMAPVMAGGAGIVGVAIMAVFTLLGGGDLGDIFNQVAPVLVNQQNTNPEEFAGEDDYEKFSSAVLGSNDEMWDDLFEQMGKQYEEPTLVLFRNATRSSCGNATSSVGPHYCPLDNTIYLDETFFDEMKKQFGAQGGDLAEAYVISHEVGHHVQNLLGTLDKVHRSQSQQDGINLELQADCFAGLWLSSIKDDNVFDPREIQEAMDAAAAVGDDNIQEKVNGQVDPESWTHGSSDQRVTWFNRGFESGSFESCNTFK